jgi:hypothetical protein
MQDAYVVVLTAIEEYDSSKGKLSTCVAKIARRFLMRKKREIDKRKLQYHAGTMREYELSKEADMVVNYPEKSKQYLDEKAGALWK